MGTPEHQRAYEIEKWNGKATVWRNPVSDLGRSLKSSRYSSSCSSDLRSDKGGFSSAETDYSSSHSESKSRSSFSCYSMKKLKPIRTSISVDRLDRHRIIDALNESDDLQVHQAIRPKFHKQEEGVAKANSKALRNYWEFKRASRNDNKQPVSPVSKLAGFLNSIFNSKKEKISSGRAPESGHLSTCCSTSSFSRSYLSKSPFSRGKFTNDRTKRSTRFHEDCWPCRRKTVILGDYQDSGSRKSAVDPQEAGKPLKNPLEMRGNQALFHEDDQEEEDGASCSSSDLFELDNLSGIGGYGYSEELPVYETTNLDTNKAIANGLMVSGV